MINLGKIGLKYFVEEHGKKGTMVQTLQDGI
jgi:hypothetical protein